MNFNRKAFYAVLSVFLAGFAIEGYAEPETLPPEILQELRNLPNFPPATGPDPQRQTQTERQQTVARALRNLQSEVADERRAAVMLLGKYNLPEAREGVISALTDESGAVRLAAVVSLFESPRGLPRHAQWQVLALLGDEEVSVRRIVSNVLPFVASAFPVSFDRERRESIRDYPEEFRRLIKNAFSDEDPLVRRNMISNYRQLHLPLPEDRMVALLHDEDPEVAIIALQTADRALSSSTFSREAKHLASTRDRTYRLNLTRMLAHHREADALEALRTLSGDEDRQIRLEASLALFISAPSREDYHTLIENLQEGRLFPETTEKILQAAAHLGVAGKPFLVEGLEHPSTLYRRTSAQTLFSYFPREVAFSDLSKLLHDDARDIRERAQHFLLRMGHIWSAEEVSSLASSPHSANRLAVLELLPRLPRETRVDLLQELLLDDHHEVQANSLLLIAREQIPGWESILFRATRLDSPQIRRNAIQGLMANPTEQSVEYLQRIAGQTPESRESRQIQAFLQNR